MNGYGPRQPMFGPNDFGPDPMLVMVLILLLVLVALVGVLLWRTRAAATGRSAEPPRERPPGAP